MVWLEEYATKDYFLVLVPAGQAGALFSIETLPEGWRCYGLERGALGLDVPATIDASVVLKRLLVRTSHYEIEEKARTRLSVLTNQPFWKRVVPFCTRCRRAPLLAHQLVTAIAGCFKSFVKRFRQRHHTQEGAWRVWIDQGAEVCFRVLTPAKQIDAALFLESFPEGWRCQKVEGDEVSLEVPMTGNGAFWLDTWLEKRDPSSYQIEEEARKMLADLVDDFLNPGSDNIFL